MLFIRSNPSLEISTRSQHESAIKTFLQERSFVDLGLSKGFENNYPKLSPLKRLRDIPVKIRFVSSYYGSSIMLLLAKVA